MSKGAGQAGPIEGTQEDDLFALLGSAKECRHRDAQGIGKLVEGTDRGGGFTALDHAQGVGGEPAGFCKGAHGEVVCLTQTTEGFPPR